MGQAIVNIEELRREGEIGFFTNIGAKLDASRGNRDRDFYSVKLRFDNNSKDAETFLILQHNMLFKMYIKEEVFTHILCIWF